jgi:hypothetical protein
MATVLELRWEGIEPEQYDEVLQRVDWENRPARGGVFHVVWFEGGAMRIIDVWESEQAWNEFMNERLGPVLAELGIDSRPDVRFHEAHRYFNTESAQARVR